MLADATIIATKLHCPFPPGPCVERDRLAARLSAGLAAGCRLVLVTGPAGFGKTTLLSSWLTTLARIEHEEERMKSGGKTIENEEERMTNSEQLLLNSQFPILNSQFSTPNASFSPFSILNSLKVVWLSLDPADNEPRRFLRYLFAAFQQIDADLGAELLSRMIATEPPAAEELLAALVNALAARPQPCALILDDGHHLKDPAVIAYLNFLLDHGPASFHLIMCSREDPPLPLARLRARRQLIEIRQHDLRCTVAEANTFLRESMGLALDSTAVEALVQRTEGWFAGLQLAGLSLQQHPDPAQFVQTFTGSDRYILDYLLDEVYSGQPPEIRELLLRSAVLPRFSASLCAALLQVEHSPLGIAQPEPRHDPAQSAISHAQSLIAQIERANLFLVPLDNERRWYRFHHLFADLLRHRLGVERGAAFVAALHHTASGWFEAQGLLPEAVEHAFASDDWPFAADLLERHGVALLERSEVALLAAWCATFPEPFLRSRPRLCVLQAWTLVLDLRSDYRAHAEALLHAAEAGAAASDPATQAWLAGHLASIRGHMLLVDPAVDPVALIESGRRALDLLPEDAGSVRSVNAMRIAYGYLGLGDVAGALAAFDAAEQLALGTGNAYAVVSCAFDRARIALAQGDLRQGLAYCAAGREQLATTLRHMVPSLPAAACLDLIEGCVLLERADLADAERCLEQGLRTVGGIQQFAVLGYPALARLRAAQGDEPGVDAALHRLVQVWPNSAVWAEGLRCCYRLQHAPNDPALRAESESWVAAHTPAPDALPRLPGIGKSFDEARYGAWLAWVRITITLGRPAQVLPLIERLLGYAEAHGLGGRLIELNLLRATAFEALGDRAQALVCLRSAEALAEAQGYRQIVAAEPRLALLSNNATRPEQKQPPAEAQITPATRLPTASEQAEVAEEQLSERELDVLRLLVEEPSYDAIAQQLVISPNTVKSHIKHIYEKLAVRNRRQAIAIARARGLLS